MNKKKIVKKILILLGVLISVFVIYKVIQTYALFQSDSTGQISEKVSSWTIFVNNTNIVQSQTFTINQFNLQTNEHVRAGKIAPGMSGSFDITIVPTGTNVSIRYDISLDKSQLTNNNIKINSIQEVNENNILTQTSQDIYTGIIPLEKIQAGDTNLIRTTVEWANTEDNSTQDTNLGTVLNSKVSVPVIVNVSQYLGETITAYTP